MKTFCTLSLIFVCSFVLSKFQDAKHVPFKRDEGKVTFASSDKKLVEGFNWAKKQALAYVFHGDPVGDWYEAALPHRSAFCMRDVSHQSLGAHILGLVDLTLNMVRKFAASIAYSRDWCGYWEIDKYDRPAPVDYTNDTDFWYNLPANFELLVYCHRQYMWTGWDAYLNDPVMQNFYNRSMNDYIERWDKDGDGIPEGAADSSRRGIASFREDYFPKIGNDLVATEYWAYLRYADLLRLKGNGSEAKNYLENAKHLRTEFNNRWWDENKGGYYEALLYNGRWTAIDSFPLAILLSGISGNEKRSEKVLDAVLKRTNINVEYFSYIPETAYRFDREDTGYRTLLQLCSPDLNRREYPEVSFAAIGTFATGLMGIEADASSRTVSTISRLTPETEWAVISNVPVFDNEISVNHEGKLRTTFTNQSGGMITWKARFYSYKTILYVDGHTKKADHEKSHDGRSIISVKLDVKSGEKITVRVK